MIQPRVIIEFRPRLQSCQVYYHVNHLEDKDIVFSIDVQPSAITFKCDVYEEKFVFDSIKLKPISINELKADKNDFITCRLQTLVSIDNKKCENCSFKFIPNVECGKSVQIKCRCCQSHLLKEDSIFKRVLPLPSSDISSGEFFCHPCEGDDFTCSQIQPKSNDLLYGNYFFKLNNDLLIESKMISVQDIVYCKECRTWIGTKDNVSTKMWNCTVGFDNHSESEASAKEDFICVVKSILEDWLGIMCKVLITYKATSVGASEYLLLWVMDRELTVLVGHEGNDRLVEKSAIKLLYSHEKSDSEIVPEWQKDNNTNTLDVAETMFTEGLNYLEQTNCLFPEMFRKANNMSVGYLGI